MNPELASQPQSDYEQDTLASKDGVIEVEPRLSLDLDDKYIISTLHNLIEKSEREWNKTDGFNLKNKRKRNMQFLGGDHLRGISLYAHQTRFIDNELFVGVDAISSYVTAQTPRSEVYPAADSPEDRAFASDLEKYHQAHSDKFNLAQKFDSAVFNALAKYVGIIYQRFNPDYGKHGEIVPEVVDPEHVILDYDCKLGENPRFICLVLEDTLEGLIAQFPEKEKDILRVAKIERKGTVNVTAKVAYRMVYFTYYDKDNQPKEAVCWYMGNLVLDKSDDPNWFFGSDEGENFLDNPHKPFTFINVQNDGSHLIDKTSVIEQAIPQQEILNKLGRQILDNLSTANGTKVMASSFMTKDDAENLTGDPNQTIIGKLSPGQGLNDVIMQLEPQLVSEQLVRQMQDARQTIHNILGTPSQFRGDDQDPSKTATQAMMIKDQASGRQDKIVRAIEYAASDYFNLLTQMMCIWYDDKHYATVNGGDGAFDRIEMHKGKIKPDMTVHVASGTTLPFDKARQESVAQNAAELGLLAPYDYYRLMHMDNPQKLYDNLVKWKTQPQQLAMDNAANDANREAIIDFTELMASKEVEQRTDITEDYIDQMRKLMISDAFLDARRPVQKKIIKFVDTALQGLSLRQELEALSNPQAQAPQPAMPTPLPKAVAETLPPAPAPAPMPMAGPMPASPMPGAPMPAPAASPIASIMSGAPLGATPPQGNGPALNPQVPQVNGANIGQLPPF